MILMVPASKVFVPVRVMLTTDSVEAIVFTPVPYTITVLPSLEAVPLYTQMFPVKFTNVIIPEITFAAEPLISKNPELELPEPVADPP